MGLFDSQTSVAYFLVDLIWVSLVPYCVKSPGTIVKVSEKCGYLFLKSRNSSFFRRLHESLIRQFCLLRTHFGCSII